MAVLFSAVKIWVTSSRFNECLADFAAYLRYRRICRVIVATGLTVNVRAAACFGDDIDCFREQSAAMGTPSFEDFAGFIGRHVRLRTADAFARHAA
jgi:hypothetical protein